jgi:hypothetical protein
MKTRVLEAISVPHVSATERAPLMPSDDRHDDIARIFNDTGLVNECLKPDARKEIRRLERKCGCAHVVFGVDEDHSEEALEAKLAAREAKLAANRDREFARHLAAAEAFFDKLAEIDARATEALKKGDVAAYWRIHDERLTFEAKEGARYGYGKKGGKV